MQGVGMVVAGALLFALLLLIAAMLLWQEVRKGTFRNPPTYVLEEAVPFVMARLPERIRLGADDVRRILEWSVAYLQRTPGGVAGGEGAVAHVVERTRTVQGIEYPPEDVRAVLEADALYWSAIGALGAAVEEEGLPSPSGGGWPSEARPGGGRR